MEQPRRGELLDLYKNLIDLREDLADLQEQFRVELYSQTLNAIDALAVDLENKLDQ